MLIVNNEYRGPTSANPINTSEDYGVTVPEAPRGTSLPRSSLQAHRPLASIRHVQHVHYLL